MNSQTPPGNEHADDHVGDMIVDGASALFQRFGAIGRPAAHASAEEGRWNAEAWTEVEEAGFGAAMLPEGLGGVGPLHALAIVRLSGAHALALPVPETIGANWLLVKAGLDPVGGPLTFVEGDLDLERDRSKWRISGNLARVPWARACDVISVGRHAGAAYLVRIERGAACIIEGKNIAGEPRDDCRFDSALSAEQVARLPDGFEPSALRRLGAVLRTAQMAGAMSSALQMSVAYARDRRQFGRPIGDFQAVQQLLAVMASQAAAAGTASDLAAGAVIKGLEPLAIAAAKVRAGEAAGVVAAIAHQVHGAIGFTGEHSLHQLTRRLWAWRDEFGSEAEWSIRLGRALIARADRGLWPALTAI